MDSLLHIIPKAIIIMVLIDDFNRSNKSPSEKAIEIRSEFWEILEIITSSVELS